MKGRFRLMLLGTLVFLCSSSVVQGEEPALSLSLETDAQAYVLGVPVVVRVTLKNVSAARVTVRDVADYLLEVEDSDGVFRDVKYRDLEVTVTIVPFPLEPGEERVGWTHLLFRRWRAAEGERQLISPSPGAYTFRIRGIINLVGKGGELIRTDVLSNEVRITVLPPEKGFAAFLSGLRKHTGDHARLSPQGAPWMEQFIRQYPETTYAQYAKGFIISYRCANLNSAIAKVHAEPNLVQWAGEVVEKLGTKRGHFSSNALYVLAVSHLLKGEVELAEQLKTTLVQEYPGSGYSQALASFEEDIQRKGLPAVKADLDRYRQMVE
jgi:hypothetical protein